MRPSPNAANCSGSPTSGFVRRALRSTRSVSLASPLQAGARARRCVPARHQIAVLGEQPLKPTATVTDGQYQLSRSTCQRDAALGVSRRMLGPHTTQRSVPRSASMTPGSPHRGRHARSPGKQIRDPGVAGLLPFGELRIEQRHVAAQFRQSVGYRARTSPGGTLARGTRAAARVRLGQRQSAPTPSPFTGGYSDLDHRVETFCLNHVCRVPIWECNACLTFPL